MKKVMDDQTKKLSSAREDRNKVVTAYNSEKARREGLEKELGELKIAHAKQSSLVDELKADQAHGRALEKERVENAAFEEGLNSYVATFLAGEPSFDWVPHFGRGMAKFMADFAVIQEELITFKRDELKEMLAKEAATAEEAR